MRERERGEPCYDIDPLCLCVLWPAGAHSLLYTYYYYDDYYDETICVVVVVVVVLLLLFCGFFIVVAVAVVFLGSFFIDVNLLLSDVAPAMHHVSVADDHHRL